MTPAQITEQAITASVRGGELTGTLWNADATGAPVLAIHGITANHTSFRSLAERIDAPMAAFDLRGRGRSRDVGAPYGLPQHAQDMAAALDALGWGSARVVGHSMGAFVAVRLAAQQPDRVSDLTLLDGGLPLAPVPGADPAALLGPAVDRLSMQFATRDDYRAFWGQHPAFGPYWNPYIERYVDYDLFETDGGLQPTAVPDAVLANVVELDGRDGYIDQLCGLRIETVLFVSPRGLQDETPGLYKPEWIRDWAARLPQVRVVEVPDTNHYTVLLSDAVQAVAAEMSRR